MELSKKTTILLSPELHAHLTRLAKQKGVSLGRLVRSACETHYGTVSAGDRIAAVDELQALELPVGEPGAMKRESVPAPEELLP